MPLGLSLGIGASLSAGDAVYPNPGDYLVTAIGGDNLTDESNNQLTA
jgi:hypothetical protein